MHQALLLLLLAPPSFCFAHAHNHNHIPRAGSPPSPLWRRSSSGSSKPSVPAQGFYDPRDNNGSFLTAVPGTFPAGLSEPINVILSALSDPAVLVDQETNGGLRNYWLSVGFAGECLGQHSGSDQSADLGDGHGYLNETAVMRWDYGDAQLGTCTETIQGGNHFRYWVQDGSSANSGAIFMALSYELPLTNDHDIVTNGYNLARDYYIGNATQQTIPTANLTNTSTFVGQTSYAGWTYQTSVTYVSGLLPNTSDGINHYWTVSDYGALSAVDGLSAILNVTVITKPANATSAATPRMALPAHAWPLLPALVAGACLLVPLSLLL